MSLKVGSIRPRTAESAALERLENPYRLKMGEMLSPSFLNGSSSFLQVKRITIKAWMSLNFCQIQQLTTELAAIGFLKNLCFHFLMVAIDLILFNLQIRRKYITKLYLNFDQIGRHTAEFAAIDHPKIPPLDYNGIMVSTVFLGCLLENYSKYLMTCWLSGERLFPSGLLVFYLFLITVLTISSPVLK